jgi:hypothetical protein
MTCDVWHCERYLSRYLCGCPWPNVSSPVLSVRPVSWPCSSAAARLLLEVPYRNSRDRDLSMLTIITQDPSPSWQWLKKPHSSGTWHCVMWQTDKKLSLWRPTGLWDVEDPTLSRQSAHGWRTGRALLPSNIIFLLLVLISVSGWVTSRA